MGDGREHAGQQASKGDLGDKEQTDLFDKISCVQKVLIWLG